MAGNSRGSKLAKPTFQCSECGWTTAKWVGRCGECQQWGTVAEQGVQGGQRRSVKALNPASPATLITELTSDSASTTPTGVSEFDRVLGGGIVSGSVILLAGEPGIGKSTLILDVASKAGNPLAPVLYVTGEESAGQVRARAARIGALSETLYLAAETDLSVILGHIETTSPGLVIVDSIQTIFHPDVEGAPGGITQVKEVASQLISIAKQRSIPMIVIGHVTKDGTVAGPRTLEHLVDVVCQFEGDKASQLRLVRAIKNRYGPTDEIGCFELSDAGINGLTDPSGLFISHRASAIPGTCVTVTQEGKRSLPLEVQALVAPTALSNPRRATSGIDSSRIAMILAVLHRRLGVPLMDHDVYVSTVGGMKVSEPGIDLALALAITSARTEQPIAPGTIGIGEVSLAGDLRPILGLNQRLNEAARLGFTRAIIPEATNLQPPKGMEVVQVPDLLGAAQRAGVLTT